MTDGPWDELREVRLRRVDPDQEPTDFEQWLYDWYFVNRILPESPPPQSAP